jgi:hypothetical protein
MPNSASDRDVSALHTKVPERSGQQLTGKRQADCEALAIRVANVFCSAFATLAEHKEEIELLWREFGRLRAGETILNCRTKKEYCEKVLHRSIRAAQYLLSGGNPASKRNKRETVSHPALTITHKQRERLLSAATIVGTELIPAFEKGGDISRPIAELKKIAFNSAELNSIVESQQSTPANKAVSEEVRTVALQLAHEVLRRNFGPMTQALAYQLVELFDPRNSGQGRTW